MQRVKICYKVYFKITKKALYPKNGQSAFFSMQIFVCVNEYLLSYMRISYMKVLKQKAYRGAFRNMLMVDRAVADFCFCKQCSSFLPIYLSVRR